MTSPKHDLDRLKEENRHKERIKQWDVYRQIVGVFRLFVKMLGLCGIAYCVYGSIHALAGQTTIFQTAIALLGTPGIAVTLSASVSFGSIVYGVRQRQLRKRQIKHFSDRKVELEMRLDPGRTSSNLTPFGETHPEDRL